MEQLMLRGRRRMEKLAGMRVFMEKLAKESDSS
jgi:hypothetical protein